MVKLSQTKMNELGKDELDRDIEFLTKHQQQLKLWSLAVTRRIRDLEDSYLEETPLGNIVRGWEIDGKTVPIRSRGQCDEKERIFSNSSYQSWLGFKAMEGEIMERKSNQKIDPNQQKSMQRKKISKKANSNRKEYVAGGRDSDWEQNADY